MSKITKNDKRGMKPGQKLWLKCPNNKTCPVFILDVKEKSIVLRYESRKRCCTQDRRKSNEMERCGLCYGASRLPPRNNGRLPELLRQ